MTVDAWTGEARSLAERVARFVRSSLVGGPTEPFEALVVDVARYQARVCPVSRALAAGPIDSLDDVPVVPVSLFKELDVGGVSAEVAAATFRTSGTTVGRRGVVRLRSTALYDLGAIGFARAFLGDVPSAGAHLLEDPATAPDSSLSHMVARLVPRSAWFVRGGRVDGDGLAGALRAASGPVFVGATAFALAEWLEGPTPLLPAGSCVMITGGFKGRVRAVDADELVRLAAARLGARVVLEYGMTELSSQLWAAPGQGYRAPPWLRPRVVDPETGAPLPDGVTGQLRFYDLCNLDTAVCVETLDAGRIVDGALWLEGRLPGAPVRGCSLVVEDAGGALP